MVLLLPRFRGKLVPTCTRCNGAGVSILGEHVAGATSAIAIFVANSNMCYPGRQGWGKVSHARHMFQPLMLSDHGSTKISGGVKGDVQIFLTFLLCVLLITPLNSPKFDECQDKTSEQRVKLK